VLTIDVSVCISKLAMFMHRQIKRDDQLSDDKKPEGRRAKENISQMRDHQEMLAHYTDMLCGLRGPHQTVVGESLQQASKCLRKI
jgi:hypothetical protein